MNDSYTNLQKHFTCGVRNKQTKQTNKTTTKKILKCEQHLFLVLNTLPELELAKRR